MNLESDDQRLIRLAVADGAPHARLFRNAVGFGWVGNLVRHQGKRVLLDAAHRITFGLVEGSGDLIGWTTITITPDMVGQKVAVFTSGEVKRARRPAPFVEKQRNWMKAVLGAGGFADVIKTPEDGLRLVRATGGRK